MQHLEKIVFGVVLAVSVVLVVSHGTSGVNVTKTDSDANALAVNMKGTTAPRDAAAPVPAAEQALNPFVQTVASPPRAGRWSFYRRPTLRGVAKVKPDLRTVLDAPALTAARTNFTVKLDWSGAETSTAGVTAWRIYRWVGDATPDKTPVAELKHDVTSWTDGDAAALAPEAVVHYGVTAMTADETRHGTPESPQSEPVTVTMPYDRELVYYGAAWKAGEGKAAEVYVKRWHNGAWRGPERFTVKTGEVIGATAYTDVDGEHVELEFATKWTLKDADKSSEKRDVDGVERIVEEKWIELVDAAGAVTKVLAVEKPKSAGTTAAPKDPVSKIALELFDQSQAARSAKDFDEATRLTKLREWLTRNKAKYWSAARKEKRTEQLEKDIHNFGIDILDEKDKDRPKDSKIKELEAKIAILKRIGSE